MGPGCALVQHSLWGEPSFRVSVPTPHSSLSTKAAARSFLNVFHAWCQEVLQDFAMVLAGPAAHAQFPSPEKTERILLGTGEF